MSVWSRIYDRINWKNYPSVQTPINERNLNKMDSALYDIETRVLTLNNNIQGAITSLSLNSHGDIDISTFGGGTSTLPTDLNNKITSISINRTTGNIEYSSSSGAKTVITSCHLNDIYEYVTFDKQNSTIRFKKYGGTIVEVPLDALIIEKWFGGTNYTYGDIVSHDGYYWKCVYDGNTAMNVGEPCDGDSYWKK